MATQRILYLTDWFTPAFRAGGPIRSAHNLVDMGLPNIEFWVVTSNRDLGGEILQVQTEKWHSLNAENKVMYIHPQTAGPSFWRRRIEEVQPDIFHVNSMFSWPFAILPMITIGSLKRWKDVVISPRGMLEEKALAYKSWKKQGFIHIVKFFSWPGKVMWHPTNAVEKGSIQRAFGPKIRYCTISNPCMRPVQFLPCPEKKKGEIVLCHVGRIHPIKGLLWALKILPHIQANRLLLHIIGPQEDEEYVSKCKEMERLLPPQMKLIWHGSMPTDQVHDIQRESHALILPSRSENFGHAIYESFAMGRPVVIGDTTPWLGLEEKGVGYSLPLDQRGSWIRALQILVDADHQEFLPLCQQSFKFARDFWSNQHFLNAYSQLYRRPPVKEKDNKLSQ